jgi:inhibitor of cysteine peptidase
MKKIAITIFVLLIACGILFGCSPRHTISIGEAENGKTVEINAGDMLKISLAGNPTTGYNWYVSSVDTQVLAQVGDPSFVASSNAMGAGGIITLTFQAPIVGQTSLQLQYKRAWETGVAPLQTYSLMVVVK